MNAAPLPVLAAVALPAAVAPTSASSSAPATAPGAFAQQLSQAQASVPAEDTAAEASPEAQAPTPPPADVAAPQRPASTSEEAPVARSLKQWLQQSAAARRAANKAVHDAARLPPQAAGDGERTESLAPGARARRVADDAEIDTTAPPATPNGGIALDPAAVDMSPRADDPARGSALEGLQTADKAIAAAPGSASPATAPMPSLPAPGTPSPVSDATTSLPAAVTLTINPGRTQAGSDETVRTEPEAAADDRSGAIRPALSERAAAPAKGDGALEAARQGATAASPAIAGKGAREAAVDSAAPTEERESFATALARQPEGVALPIPPAPQAGAPAARTEATPAAPRPPVDVPVPADFNGPQWAQSVGNQLSLLATDGVQNARLHLHPAEMGPISVQIVVDGQTAQVHLAVDNAETRQALEQAMPNLAASLRESGLTLTGGGVFEQPRQRADNPSDETRPGSGRGNERGAGNERTEALAGSTPPARSLRRQGVVDLYA